MYDELSIRWVMSHYHCHYHDHFKIRRRYQHSPQAGRRLVGGGVQWHSGHLPCNLCRDNLNSDDNYKVTFMVLIHTDLEIIVQIFFSFISELVVAAFNQLLYWCFYSQYIVSLIHYHLSSQYPSKISRYQHISWLNVATAGKRKFVLKNVIKLRFVPVEGWHWSLWRIFDVRERESVVQGSRDKHLNICNTLH